MVVQVFKPQLRIQRQWHEDLGVVYEYNIWKKVYEHNRKAILGSKYRAFSYRYIHRILVFNKLAYKFGRSDRWILLYLDLLHLTEE